MPGTVIIPRGAQISVRWPCAVGRGCLVTYLLQIEQRCLDTDAQRGLMPGGGGDSLAGGDARWAAVGEERWSRRSGAGRGGAGVGRSGRSLHPLPCAPPVPRQRADWEPSLWGRARVWFNLQLRRDYGRRIASNPRHRPPGAACPSPQQRHHGEGAGRSLRSPPLLALPGSFLREAPWLEAAGHLDPSPPLILLRTPCSPFRPIFHRPRFPLTARLSLLLRFLLLLPGPGSSGRCWRSGAVCFALLLPLPSG